jgi:hypothetical protein
MRRLPRVAPNATICFREWEIPAGVGFEHLHLFSSTKQVIDTNRDVRLHATH